MFRRAVMPLVAVGALAAILFVVLPAGAIGSEATAKTTRTHDAYAFGHDFVVRDVIDGDLLVVGGNVVFTGSGRVRGNVVYAGGRVIGGEGRIDGRAYPLASIEGAAASMTRTAVALSLLFVWLIAAVGVTLVSGREVRFSSIEMRASSLHCFVLGLVAFTSFVLTAIMFSYLVPFLVGIPLLAALAVFAILAKIYGMVAVFHAVGSLVAGPRTREQLASRKWLRGDVAMVVIGVLILGAIRLIPLVGTLAWSGASIFGIGVALATKFGRREPWFLAWRPAEA